MGKKKTEERPRLISFTALNTFNLKAARIEMKGNTLVVGGPNGAGKTALLDALEYLIRGKAGAPKHRQIIRHGATKSELIGDFGTIVVRRVTRQGSMRLEVEDAEGCPVRPPQERLDELFGMIGFDPLAIIDMKPEKQAEALGLDLSGLKDKADTIFKARTELNRSITRTQTIIDNTPLQEGLPTEEVSTAALQNEAERRRVHNQGNDRQRDFLVQLAREKTQTQEECGRLDNRIHELHETLVALKKEYVEAVNTAKEKDVAAQRQGNIVDSLETLDEAEVAEQIRNSGSLNARIRRQQERAQLIKENTERRRKAKQLTSELEDARDAIPAAIASANLPKGLGFDDEDGLMWEGESLRQKSTGDALKIASKIGVQRGGKMPILIIRTGPALDLDNLATVKEICEKSGAYALIERTTMNTPEDPGPECDLIIEAREDGVGEVVEDRRPIINPPLREVIEDRRADRRDEGVGLDLAAQHQRELGEELEQTLPEDPTDTPGDYQSHE